MKKSQYHIIALILLLICESGFTQRRIDTPSNTDCARQAVVPISEVLDLKTDMPVDCRHGYLFFDSVCRGLISSYLVDDNLNMPLDNLDTIIRYIYRMQEYDDDIYNEYLYGSKYLNTNYRFSPAYPEMKYFEQMSHIFGRQNKFNYLVATPIILHIRIIDKGITNDSLSLWEQGERCIAAIVLDTIKGTHFRQGRSPLKKPRSAKKMISANDSWINLGYFPTVSKLFAQSDNIHNGTIDSKTGEVYFNCDSCYGTNAFEEGREYIIFLENSYLDYNGKQSFYEYIPYPHYNEEGGIFPIDEKGNVLSQDDYFGYGKSIPFKDFIALLRRDIEHITSH